MSQQSAIFEEPFDEQSTANKEQNSIKIPKPNNQQNPGPSRQDGGQIVNSTIKGRRYQPYGINT